MISLKEEKVRRIVKITIAFDDGGEEIIEEKDGILIFETLMLSAWIKNYTTPVVDLVR